MTLTQKEQDRSAAVDAVRINDDPVAKAAKEKKRLDDSERQRRKRLLDKEPQVRVQDIKKTWSANVESLSEQEYQALQARFERIKYLNRLMRFTTAAIRASKPYDNLNQPDICFWEVVNDIREYPIPDNWVPLRAMLALPAEVLIAKPGSRLDRQSKYRRDYGLDHHVHPLLVDEFLDAFGWWYLQNRDDEYIPGSELGEAEWQDYDGFLAATPRIAILADKAVRDRIRAGVNIDYRWRCLNVTAAIYLPAAENDIERRRNEAQRGMERQIDVAKREMKPSAQAFRERMEEIRARRKERGYQCFDELRAI